MTTVNEAVNAVEESTESTSDAVTLAHSTADKSNEATMTDKDVVQQINIVEDFMVDATNIVADIRNEEKEIVNSKCTLPININCSILKYIFFLYSQY